VTDAARAALSAWDVAQTGALRPASSGLINTTFLLSDDRGETVAVLQRLHGGVFRPTVHLDTDGLMPFVRAAGLVTPRLIRTRAGALWHEAEDGCWRMMSVVGSSTYDVAPSLAHVASAAGLVARFHGALAGVDWTFHHVRPAPHDTAARLMALQGAVVEHRGHRHHDEVAALADQLGKLYAQIARDTPAALPTRIVHGDLKLSNVRFDGETAVALIDLDTLAHGTLDAELGDAMRSWCGRGGEDAASIGFDLPTFGAAMRGYAAAARGWGPTDDEWASLVVGTARIAAELAMRFAADALAERYFGWDRTKFASAGDHNLLRARGQASLAAAVWAARREAERELAAARA
jgi:Ser/Thr protein kinase RdoA (MazF antagonist)